MVVYADVLIVLNMIVDYFLLKICSKILKITPRLWRILLSSLAGAVFSLYIFFPESNILTEFTVRLAMNGIMALICYGFKNLKWFLKAMGSLFAVTCLYAGVMIALWQIFKPHGMVIHNSVVYFNISPIILIEASVLAYFIYIAAAKIFASSAKYAPKCEIKLFANCQNVGATAIVDTGNSITDIFGKSQIIIVDKSVLLSLFGDLDITRNEEIKNRFRTIPCGTVSGGDLLQGFRCDKAEIFYENRVIKVEKPIAAISKAPLREDYSAILNPQILDITGEENGETEKLTV